MFSLSQAGATPGVGLQLRDACYGPAGSGHKIKRTYRLCAHPPKPQSGLGTKTGDSSESHK